VSQTEMSQTEASPLALDEVKGLVENIGEATEQVESLLITLQSDDEELRAWASDALQEIDQIPKSLSLSLGRFCLHAKAPVASWACKLIGKSESAASEQQHCIADALGTHPELGVRQQAALVLAQIPDLTTSTLSALEVAAASDDPRLSRLAMQANEKNKTR